MPFGEKAGYGSLLKPDQLRAGRAVGEVERPQLDNVFKRAERSLVATGSASNVTADQRLCIIPGFQTAKQFAMYRLDWSAIYDGSPAHDADMAIFLGGVHYYTLPLGGSSAVQQQGTVFIAPNGADVEIRSVLGGGSNGYICSLVMTRMLDGDAVG